jgi:hypothetical protein
MHERGQRGTHEEGTPGMAKKPEQQTFAVAVGSLQINDGVVPHKAEIRPEIVSHAEYHAAVKAARAGGQPMRPEVMTRDMLDELLASKTLVEPIAVLDQSEAQAALDAKDTRIQELLAEIAQLRANQEMDGDRAPQEPEIPESVESVEQTAPEAAATVPTRVSKRRG